MRHTFARHILDGAVVRAVLLDLVVQLAHQVAEAVSDRIRDKFGPGAIGPAATFLRVA